MSFGILEDEEGEYITSDGEYDFLVPEDRVAFLNRYPNPAGLISLKQMHAALGALAEWDRRQEEAMMSYCETQSNHLIRAEQMALAIQPGGVMEIGEEITAREMAEIEQIMNGLAEIAYREANPSDPRMTAARDWLRQRRVS